MGVVQLDPPAPWLWILLLPLVLGGVALTLGWVRRSAFLLGVPFGALVLFLGGLGGFGVLVGFFLLGTALTRLGYSAKEAKGVAEEQGGRRGSSHVLANCGMGLILLVVRFFASDGGNTELDLLLWSGYCGSFAAAASDTASSEIGQLYGRRTVSLRTFRAVPVGTEGAVSLEGLAGGLFAAVVIGFVGLAMGRLDPIGVACVAGAGFLGNFIESLVGTWGRKLLPHGGLNFANTVVGAVLAMLFRAIS